MRLSVVVWAAALLAAAACSFGIRFEPPPPAPPEIPVPRPYAASTEGAEQPTGDVQLQPSDYPGLEGAPKIDPALFYSRAEGLWYRYWRGRWYQAFRWNGYWFPPAKLPEVLAAGRPPQGIQAKRRSEPAADAQTRGMPRDERGLPTLPEFLDPNGGNNDPNALEEIED